MDVGVDKAGSGGQPELGIPPQAISITDRANMLSVMICSLKAVTLMAGTNRIWFGADPPF